MRSRALIVALACLSPAVFPFTAAQSAAPAKVEVVTTTSTCRYLNQANAKPGPRWADPAFDDSRWRAGRQPFGHLEPTAATDVGLPAKVAYFRCSFEMPAGGRATSAKVSLRADDGAIVLLNGRDVGRYNVPAGPPDSIGYATRIDPYDGKRWNSYSPDPKILKPGRNTLAIQVHAAGQPSWLSADLTMEAKLAVTLANPPPAAPKPPVRAPGQPQPGSQAGHQAPPRAPAGWRLLMSEEFNGNRLNTSRWRAYSNTYGDGDPFMLHCLTPDNVKVSGGTLKLHAQRRPITCANGKRRNYASGFIGSRDAGTYYPLFGRFEVRARTPHGQGLFPAIWLRHSRGAGTAEVDIFELFHSSAPGHATQTLHFPTTIGYNVAKKGTFFEPAVRGRGGWHTFSVDITPVRPGDRSQARFRFAIDGKTTLEYVNTRMSSWSGSDRAWDIALQLYVGGRWAGMPDRDLGFYPAQGGICAQNSRRPASGKPSNCPRTGIWLAPWHDAVFEIDYVRVYVPR